MHCKQVLLVVQREQILVFEHTILIQLPFKTLWPGLQTPQTVKEVQLRQFASHF